MINILFYGNCQLGCILHTLNLSKNYNIFHLECCRDINKDYFTDIIMKCDIIITQPINDNYRDVDYLSTNYIIKHKQSNCKLIICDSCYFNFYYFDLTYKYFNNELLHKPIDYHYNNMINCYNQKLSIDHYITNFIDNMDLKSSEELETIAQDSLNELKNRNIHNKEKYNDTNMFIIQTYDYVKNNYKDKLLFYSMNHPTKYLIQFICEQIVDILKIENTINCDIDLLKHTKCILYKCISKNVHFDIKNHNSLILGNTDNNTITQLYYDAYKEVGLNN